MLVFGVVFRNALGGVLVGFWVDFRGLGKYFGRVLGGFWEGFGRNFQAFWAILSYYGHFWVIAVFWVTFCMGAVFHNSYEDP